MGAARSGARARRPWVVSFVALLALGALLAGFVSVKNTSARQHERAEAAYVHTLDILLVTGELKTSLNEALRGERGFLLTADPRALETYRRGRERAPELLARLERITRDNPRQRTLMPRLADRLDTLMRAMDRTVELRSSGRSAEAMRVARGSTGPNAARDVFAVLGTVEREERRLLEIRRAEAGRARADSERLSTLLDVKAAVLLVIVALAAYQTLRVQRRLELSARELAHAARTDPQTGLPNRRAILARLEEEVVRARNTGVPLSLAIVDIDHFKRINDTHGHPAGDAAIAAAADRMTGTLRAIDVVGRIGGEEFAVLMPGADEEMAAALCERLRATVKAAPVSVTGDGTIAITISLGVACLAEGEEGDGLISRADKALYRAKRGGRNQVQLAA